jgi:RNA polymerase primary sigma factor
VPNDAVATAVSRGQSQLADFLKETFARRDRQSKDEAKTGSGSAESPKGPDAQARGGSGSGGAQTRSSAPALGEAPPPEVQQVDLGSPAAEPLYDISAWQVENEAPIPENDLSCASEAAVLQAAISSHEVIDRDKGWEEVEIHLPELDDLVRKYVPLTPKQEQALRTLFIQALGDGRIQPDRIADVISEIFADGSQDERIFEKNLHIVLEDLGVVVEDDPFCSAAIPDDYADENLENVATEALAFLGRLQSNDADPLALYAKEIPAELLSRSDELELGAAIEAGMKESLAALASSPAVRAKLVADLEAVGRGATPARMIFDLSLVERGPKNGESTSGAPNDEEPQDGKDEAKTDDTGVPPDLASHVSAILSCCSRVRGDSAQGTGELADVLFLASLSSSYLKELGAIAEQDSAAQGTPELVKRGLEKAQMARKRLVETNLKLVIRVARRYGGLPLMDRIQEGNIGLMRAAERFDFRRGVKFSTYAVWWIRQAILRANADTVRMIRLPVHAVESLRKVERARSRLFCETGHEPLAEQIAGLVEMSPHLVKRLLDVSEEPFSLDSDEAEGIKNIIDDHILSPETATIVVDTKAAVRRAMKCLKPKKDYIIRQRFGIDCEEHTLEEVGQTLNVTRERIRQIEAKALRKLRRVAELKGLLP